MKQEDKELLIRDLCCRTPYGVKVQYDMTGEDFDDDPIGEDTLEYCSGRFSAIGISEDIPTENLKPYLRPLSSMTDAERDELLEVRRAVQYNGNEMCAVVDARFAEAEARWYDKKMFDHRGLLPKGLALEMPKEMYKS